MTTSTIATLAVIVPDSITSRTSLLTSESDRRKPVFVFNSYTPDANRKPLISDRLIGAHACAHRTHQDGHRDGDDDVDEGAPSKPRLLVEKRVSPTHRVGVEKTYCDGGGGGLLISCGMDVFQLCRATICQSLIRPPNPVTP